MVEHDRAHGGQAEPDAASVTASRRRDPAVTSHHDEALVAALGLLPVALATGVGTDTQRPFALVIVSGLFTRLLISIFLMPALYALVARPGDRLEV
jgi:Cu/Ag efflux pump CusA